MSTYVIGFAPPDKQWKKMKAIWDACAEAKIDPPDEVEKFFGGEPPDDNGVEVNLDGILTEYNAFGQDGYELEVSKIPTHVKVLRFYNSW